MRRLWTEPVVDFAGKWVKFETMPAGSQADPEAARADHRRRLCRAAFRRAVRFGAGWYGFNLDPAATKEMLDRLDAAFAKAGRKRGEDFQIIVTPPMSMPMDSMQEYAEIGVDRLVVHLGSQRPERVDQRMAKIEKLVRSAAQAEVRQGC